MKAFIAVLALFAAFALAAGQPPPAKKKRKVVNANTALVRSAFAGSKKGPFRAKKLKN